MSPSPRWIGVRDDATLRILARRRIVAAANNAIRARRRFLIVLSGGDTPREIYRSLRDAETDWSHWHIYFSDERCVPQDDPLRNSRMAREVWLDHVPIPRAQIHVIPAELGPHTGARAAADDLRGVGAFDLVLLGLGEDGHTASLFSCRSPSAGPAPDVLPVVDAPKPPRERVTLSAARLSCAREVLFLIAGTSKQQIVARWHADEPIPASWIRPDAGVDVLLEATLLPRAKK
jgi:6-phosphogluconolactonase